MALDLRVPKLEADLGIGIYASSAKGIDGRIRSRPADFVVEEILTDGSRASVKPFHSAALPLGHGRYLVCELIKKGWDTLVVVRQIAKQIGVSPGRISIAGMKDTRAVTAQHISIGGIPAERVLKVHLHDVKVNPLRFSSDKISSRLLFGNHFNITVRSVKFSSRIVERRIAKTREELKDRGGIPNFFGHQRFGTVRPITHQVGRCLVRQNFEEAALIFLSESSPDEHPKARRARRRLRETRDFKTTLRLFPRRFTYERLMVRHLSKYPRDFLGAFRRLPRKLRRLFVQAYQSYLFNRFLSQRTKRGIPVSNPQIGDYVIELNEKGLPTFASERVEESNISEISRKTEEGQMAVVLPLIGFRQAPSDGLQGEIEKEILEKEGIEPDDFRIEKMVEASAPGTVRRSVVPVLDLEIKDEEQTADQDGLGVKFSFALHKGSYATVLLREFMKPRDLVRAGF
jgi:tRNA pseudouridine13 synthase